MATSSTSFSLFFLLVVVGNVVIDAKDSCDFLDKVGGGCPDAAACKATCDPCYREIGTIESQCIIQSGNMPVGVCRCYFKDGAPCPPLGGPRCPGGMLGYHNSNVTEIAN